MKTITLKTFALLVSIALISCNNYKNRESQKISGADTVKTELQKIATADTLKTKEVIAAEPDSGRQAVGYYCSSPASDKNDPLAKKLIGKILPDTEDSTLLKFVYGSFTETEDGYAYNNGPQIYNEKDSVYMKIAESFGNDSVELVYIRGEMAISCTMHNVFNETALLFNKTAKGWKVMDAYVDIEEIDYNGVELVDIYSNGLLFKYSTEGVYAGGVSFGSIQYKLIPFTSLNGQSVSFITERSNTASIQCASQEDDKDYHCDCYSSEGKVEFQYNEKWNCFVFTYNYTTENADCEFKDPHKEKAHQTWYMNADTSFIANGNELSEWGDNILGAIKLEAPEIKKLLKVKT